MITNEIICGNSLEILQELPDSSVDMILTSPPYDNLRDYKGFDFGFNEIALELGRVLKTGGVIVWVVGDATLKGSETGTSFRQALYFKDIVGLRLHDTMIYSKNNPIPLNHNRYEQEFEFMFVFSKGKPSVFNPLKMPTKQSGKTYIINRKTESAKQGGSIRFGETKSYETKEEKIRGNIWSYNVGSNQSTKDRIAFKHPAIFPEQLAEDQILTWSLPGDLILDPFNGSGTTTKVANKLDRKFLGIDISEEYCEIARQRLVL